jgi:hypothetical protein
MHALLLTKNLLVAAAAQVAEAPALDTEATTVSTPAVGAAALPEAEGGKISVMADSRWPVMAERRCGSFHLFDIISIYTSISFLHMFCIVFFWLVYDQEQVFTFQVAYLSCSP